MPNLPFSPKCIVNKIVSAAKRRCRADKVGILRLGSVFLILALLVQVILIVPVRRANATGVRPLSPPPVSAPHESFVLSNADRGFSLPAILAANLFSRLPNPFAAPSLPEGFVPSPARPWTERMVSAAAPILAALVASGSKSSKKAVKPNAPPPTSPANVSFDFDGDSKADVGSWHAAATEFKVRNSSDGSYTTVTIGSTSSKPAPGDFDGDGTTNPGVFLNGTWTYKPSPSATPVTISLGASGDIPSAGDFDGNGTDDAAVFRPSTGDWLIKYSGGGTTTIQFGASGDIPMQGDYDGDGTVDIAVYRPSEGMFYIEGSSAGSTSAKWGNPSDIPVHGDFDGDGADDPAVYRPSDGTWYVLRSDEGYQTWITQSWGSYGDQPVAGDYDGDSITDFSVWRPTTGVWYTIRSSDPEYEYHTLGVAGDTAVPSAYTKQIGSAVGGYDLLVERLKPGNATGGTNMYSQNFSWGTSLVGLPGRSGLDAGFGMSYNSLVWTKVGSVMYFDPDTSNISPGFRFGFPVIEPVYYNAVKQLWSYLMVTPGGGRVEFRQVGASSNYDTADSSYLRLSTSGASNPNDPVEGITMTVAGIDGSTMFYEWKAGAFRCNKIMDRNGNFIAIAHDDQGLLTTVTDTLGRVITVHYDSGLYPTSITQTWNDNNGVGPGTPTHVWASFSYTNITVNTDFHSSITGIYGPPDGTSVRVLDKVTYADGSFTAFEYNSYVQVKKVRNVAPDSTSHELNSVATDLGDPAALQQDCPRFNETRTKVEKFNLDQNGQPQEVVVSNSAPEVTSYNIPEGGSEMVKIVRVRMTGHPDDLYTNIFLGANGWKEGLTVATEDCLGTDNNCSNRKRWTWSKWTQDVFAGVMPTILANPRVIETRVGDGTNTKRSTATYREYLAGEDDHISYFGLVNETKVYENLTTEIKKSAIVYNNNVNYVQRRLVALPAKVETWGRESSGLVQASKVTFGYDEGGYNGTGQSLTNPTNHNGFMGTSFTYRGNVTSTTRWDADDPANGANAVTSHAKYNIAGSPISQTDPLGRITAISYADVWYDGASRTTYAYPTTVTDPANNSSTIKYRFDIGANVEANSPAPAGNTYGKRTTRQYDNKGRMEKNIVWAYEGGAWKQSAYSRNDFTNYDNVHSKVYSTITDVNSNGVADAADEVLSESWSDGAGRVYRSRTPHTFSYDGSTATWSASKVVYDIVGRVRAKSVPTEANNNWDPTGDDTAYLWTYTDYDWMDRVLRTIKTDGDPNTSNNSDILISYQGCGCAGGQITTIDGENIIETDWNDQNPTTLGRRRQKIYEDILGRAWKTEIMNWDGTTVYSTKVNEYDSRDQVIKTLQYAGGSTSPHRDVTMDFDGHGRMIERHYPIEDANANTTWTYNEDDSINTTIDPRGVTTTFGYYSTTGLLNTISYTVPSGQQSSIPQTSTVTFGYDNLGNRTTMSDGTGSATYSYNSLSQMTQETKSYTGLSGSFTVNYTYQLSGSLRTMSDPHDAVRKVVYDQDKLGRVIGADMEYQSNSIPWVHDVKFRAWGDLKELKFNLSNNVQNLQRFDYDQSLKLSTYEKQTNSQVVQNLTFRRYADGNLKFVQQSTVPWIDRSYHFDHVSRLTKGYSGKDAHDGDPNVVGVPYKQDFSYNAFSDITGIIGKQWGQNESYSKTYDSNGRDSVTDYDAAGNIVADRIQSSPFPVLSRTLKYDAAGRQVETFDPAVHACCEVDWTYTNFYDGNGWRIRTRNQSSADDRTTYEIRSTVLGGEKIGTFENHYPHKVFIAPVLGGKLTYINAGSIENTYYTRETPEGFEYDPRGAVVTDEFEVPGGPNSYPNLPDPSQYSRCTWEGLPMPCDQVGKMLNSRGYLTLRRTSLAAAKARTRSDTNALASTHEALHSDTTKATEKPKDDADKGSIVDPNSVPDDQPPVLKPKADAETRATRRATDAIYEGTRSEGEETGDQTQSGGSPLPDGFVEKRVMQLLDAIRGAPDNLLIGIGLNNKSKQDNAVILCHAANESGFVRIEQPDGSMIGIAGLMPLDRDGNELPNMQDLGLFQIQAHTANTLGLGNYNRESIRDDNELNTRLATTYLQQMVDRYGSLRTGLGAYKAGPTITDSRIRQKQSALSPKGGQYADNIIECATRIRAGALKQ